MTSTTAADQHATDQAAKPTRPRARRKPTPPTGLIRPTEARALADAEARVAAAQGKLDGARAERQVIRDKLRDRIPTDHPVTIAGVTIKLTPFARQTFSLKRYLEAGNKLTAKMREFVGESHDEKWTVKRTR